MTYRVLLAGASSVGSVWSILYVGYWRSSAGAGGSDAYLMLPALDDIPKIQGRQRLS